MTLTLKLVEEKLQLRAGEFESVCHHQVLFPEHVSRHRVLFLKRTPPWYERMEIEPNDGSRHPPIV